MPVVIALQVLVALHDVFLEFDVIKLFHDPGARTVVSLAVAHVLHEFAFEQEGLLWGVTFNHFVHPVNVDHVVQGPRELLGSVLDRHIAEHPLAMVSNQHAREETSSQDD